MILQSLVDYYDRSDEVAPPGWERVRISYLLEITGDGTFVQIFPLRVGQKRSETPTSLVPLSENRQGTRAYEKPNILWDHIGFVLGYPRSDNERDIATAKNQLEHFQSRILALANRVPNSLGLNAVVAFYERMEFVRVRYDPLWDECASTVGCNVTFRLIGQTELIVHDPAIRHLIDFSPADSDGARGVCLVTGEEDEIARKHPQVGGIGKKPAPLNSINDPAYSSYGKSQGENFPIGVVAAFKYAEVLKHLLRPGSLQSLRLGGDTAVFWAQRRDHIEDELTILLGGGDNPDAHIIQVNNLYQSMYRGEFDGARGANMFFVLGLSALSPGRLAVRFWHACSLSDLAARILQWFDDLEIVGGGPSVERPGLQRLLCQISPPTSERPHGDISKLPAATVAQTIQSVLKGGALPAIVQHAVLLRIRGDQCRKDEAGRPVRHVSALRAALLKTFVNRLRRNRNSQHKEMTVGLDKLNSEPPYLWGRMFAAYERMQEQASERELNRTIRDSYFGAAMATPRTVYNRLAKLNQVHLRELKRSRRATGEFFDRLLLEIADKLPADSVKAFPSQATPEQQACFAIGYYHQRQDFFAKRETSANTDVVDSNPEAA